MPVTRITNTGLSAITVLVVILWGCLIAERAIVRRANIQARQAKIGIELLRLQRAAVPVRCCCPLPEILSRRARPARTHARRFKPELMQMHLNAAAAKRDAFVLEPQPLFQPGSATQFDVAAGADYPVPGNGAVRRVQSPGDLTGVTWITGSTRYFAVGRNFAPGDFPDRPDQLA